MSALNIKNNYDAKTVHDFGKEWTIFNQSHLQQNELQNIFNDYFQIFPWEKLSPDAIGYDLGCGSGRWASAVAHKVKKLYCIDASADALNVAKKNLEHFSNIHFIHASVESIPIEDNSMDFGYSLGVLHHVPNTKAGIEACVKKLKKDAPLLLYLYYAFDNKPIWYRWLWKVSDKIRLINSKFPFFLKYIFSQIMAIIAYYPLARFALICEKLGFNVKNIPLSAYRTRSFYVMRTDALDRFGTRLEQRFTKIEITQMMQSAGLNNISFNENFPYWCAIGYKI
jgi:ubiquinone/menaquinone biosynthesis C-methylase UbiE